MSALSATRDVVRRRVSAIVGTWLILVLTGWIGFPLKASAHLEWETGINRGFDRCGAMTVSQLQKFWGVTGGTFTKLLHGWRLYRRSNSKGPQR